MTDPAESGAIRAALSRLRRTTEIPVAFAGMTGEGRGFRITERTPLGSFRRAAEDSSYHPISYAATQAEIGVRFPLGYDLGEDPSRRPHLRRAGDTG